MHTVWLMTGTAFYIGFYSFASGQPYSKINDLHGYLFNSTRYNIFLRPLQNQSGIIQVNFTMYLKRVEHFDISTGEILLTGFFEISWRDEFLTWDPYQYGGKESIQLPTDKFWKPNFELMNGRANVESSVYSNGAFPAWITYNGNVTVTPGGTFRSRCNIDTTLYPLDIHHCNLEFIVSNHGTDEVMIQLPSTPTDNDNIEENGEWNIENSNAAIALVQHKTIKKVSVPMVNTSFKLKRRPTFIIINVYSPLMFMTCLNIATCYVRPDSGERLSFAVTLYLSLVLTATAAIEKIPNNSLRMPYMSYEVLIVNLINTIGVTWSIFIVYLADVKIIDHKRLPTLILKMVMKRRLCTVYGSNEIEGDTKTGVNKESLTDRESITDNEDVENGSNDKSKNTPLEDISGHEVADVADQIFFWVLALAIFFLNVSIVAIILGTWAQS